MFALYWHAVHCIENMCEGELANRQEIRNNHVRSAF